MGAGLGAAYAALYILIFFVGASVAGFLNVVIYRLPNGIPIIRGRSRCDSCGAQLGTLDMLPVISYIFLRGRCRRCGGRFTARYAVVEALGGVMAVLTYGVYGSKLVTIAVFGVMAGLILVTIIDIDTMRIPNSVVLYMSVPAVFLVFLLPETAVLSHVIGLFAISVPIFILTLIVPGAFGGGDIKLFAVCGLALGWRLSLVMLFVALVTGSLWGIYLMALKKVEKHGHMVFGPFIALGAAAALLVGQPVINWYAG